MHINIKSLLENSVLLKTILDSTQDFVFLVEISKGKLVYANDRACQTLEYSLDELINIPIEQWRQPLHGNETYQTHLALIEAQKSMRTFGLITSKSGKKTPVESSLQLITLNDINYNFVMARDISEQIELQKIKENNLITNALKNIKDSAFLFNQEGKVVYANDSACKELQYTQDQLTKMHLLDIDPVADLKLWDNVWAELEAKGSMQIETKHKRKDGSIFSVDVVATLITIDNTHYNLGIARNIEDRKLFEQEMIQKNHELEVLFDNAQTGLMYITGERILIKANPRLAQILGYDSPQEMIGLSMREIHLNEENFIEFGKKNFYSLTNGTNLNVDYPLKRKDGSLIWVTLSGKALDNKIPADLSQGVLWSIQDISESKKYQQEIENQQKKYKSFIDNSSDAIFIANMDGKILEASRQCKNILGYSAKEMINLHVWDLEMIHDKELILENIHRIKEEPLTIKSQYKTKENKIIDVLVNDTHILIDNQDYVYSSIRDITKEVELEKITRKQKEEFESIFETTAEGIAIIDYNTHFLNCNQAFINLIGYSKEEILKKTCKELTLDDDWEKNEKAIKESINTGVKVNIEKRCIHNNGRIISVIANISKLPDENRLLLTLKDLTAFKLLEEQSRMAALGEMMGNIAHQWRQPLNMISTKATGALFQKEMGIFTDEMFVESMETINDSAQYLSKTIDTFKNFVKSSFDKQYITTTVQEEIDLAYKIEKATLKNNYIELITEICETPLPLYAPEGELSQVLINILNNAKDILKEKDEEYEKWIKMSLFQDEQKYTITIEDNGGGIPPEILPKIFEPYFTTKHQSSGTGLGLHMSYKIITESLKGSIIADNTINGALFTIKIPASQSKTTSIFLTSEN